MAGALGHLVSVGSAGGGLGGALREVAQKRAPLRDSGVIGKSAPGKTCSGSLSPPPAPVHPPVPSVRPLAASLAFRRLPRWL